MKTKTTEFAKEWLEVSSDDLKWAMASFEDGFYSRVCFICQQVAEKSLKGFLYFLGEPPKTHDLIRLLKICKDKDGEFEILKNEVKVLNIYYLETRYADIGDINQFQDQKLAKEAIDYAGRVLNFVEKKLKKND